MLLGRNGQPQLLIWVSFMRTLKAVLTFYEDVLNPGPEQDPAPILLYAPHKGVHNAPGTLDRVVNCRLAAVALHQHESHLQARAETLSPCRPITNDYAGKQVGHNVVAVANARMPKQA